MEQKNFKGKNVAKLLIGPEYKQNVLSCHDHHISVWLQIHLLKKEILASVFLEINIFYLIMVVNSEYP